ncbi:MAG: hypothetical protein AABX93_03795 [Nanoarchaeota archaeon]
MAENNLYRILDVFYSDTNLSGEIRGNYLIFNIRINDRAKNRMVFLNRAEYHSIFEKILGQNIKENPKLSWDGTWEKVESVLRRELEGIVLTEEQFALLGGTKPKENKPKPKNYESHHEYPVKRRIRD